LSFIDEQGSITDPYRGFIAKSRYARWLEEENRRETWSETVNRYIDFMADHMDKNYPGAISNDFWTEAADMILQHKVMPSMRALMTAGPALERSNVAGYNCSFMPVDSLRSFDEALYILMNGTGLGFSVETKYVCQLPVMPNAFRQVKDVVVVGDSKEGWAKAYRQLINHLVNGQIPVIDPTQLRPAGARLKTFGGRSSGPQPLIDLFDFTIKIFVQAAGRQLTDIEVHDIMCKIGDVVVVGGVRRSALISMSDLDSFDMAKAKSGAWWEDYGHRRLANNSATYYAKPSIGEFLREWTSLYESKSGERGIVNMADLKSNKNAPRRDTSKIAGLNPCLTGETWVITEDGPRQISDILNVETKLMLNGKLNDSTGFFKTGTKQVFRINTRFGHTVRATQDHRFMTTDGWKSLSDILPGDSLVLSNNNGATWGGPGTENQGYVLGLLVGDGCVSGSRALIDVWENGLDIKHKVESVVDDAEFKLQTQVGEEKKWRLSSRTVTEWARQFGLLDNKRVTKEIESASSDFYHGFLRGYFDADGSVQGDRIKGRSVRLTSISLDNLGGVQRMLGRLGILGKIYARRDAGVKMLPDSNREMSPYYCQALSEVIISRESIGVFANKIGFVDSAKAKKLADMLSGTRSMYKSKFEAEVLSIEPEGIEDVYDAIVPDVNAFDANGIYTHNCGEIKLRPYQFCNLTEVIIEEDDDITSLSNKVNVASILGTIQSSFTNFRYLRKIWKDNCEEERLLGVSLTGQFGNKLMSGREGTDELAKALNIMRLTAITANMVIADAMGINCSAAITTVKPSGTVSQLTATSSGMHPWHNDYYIRSVRQDNKDPLTEFMKFQGVPNEPDVMNPEGTTVFYFPQKAPEGAVTRLQLSAIDHLEFWKTYKLNWTEHNPSVTINVRENEWIEVANWVYKNWEHVGGISFLPYSEHTYQQAPYQDTDESGYNQFQADMPKEIDWNMLSLFEAEDNTTGSQTLACTSSACEIVGSAN